MKQLIAFADARRNWKIIGCDAYEAGAASFKRPIHFKLGDRALLIVTGDFPAPIGADEADKNGGGQNPFATKLVGVGGLWSPFSVVQTFQVIRGFNRFRNSIAIRGEISIGGAEKYFVHG